MNNMKFRVNSPEQSEEIQRELFRLGFAWLIAYGFCSPQIVKGEFIYATVTRYLQTISETEISGDYTETTLEELKAM